MRLPEEGEETPPQVNIVPMIDVIFAILTFFIMSTLYLTRSEGVPVNLPRAVTGEIQQSSQPITISINPEGQLFLNRQPTELEGLNSQIRPLISANKSLIVVINADEKVNHGRVIQVMDQLRTLPGVKLAIATRK